MLTYIKESHRLRGTLYEEVLCEKHFAELPVECRTPHGMDRGGYRLEVREWTGAPVDCTQCDVVITAGGRTVEPVINLDHMREHNKIENARIEALNLPLKWFVR